MQIDFLTKCKILGDMYIDSQYLDRIPDEVLDYMEQEAPHFELAWSISRGLATATDRGTEKIEDTFSGLRNFEIVERYLDAE